MENYGNSWKQSWGKWRNHPHLALKHSYNLQIGTCSIGIQRDAEKRMKKAQQEQRFAQSPGSLSLCVCVSSIPSGPTRPQNNLPVANDFPVPPTKTIQKL